MTMFRVVTYVSSAPDTPPHQRTVAHCFDADGKLLPATQMGETAAECFAKLTAFMEAEVAMQKKIEANRRASAERMSAEWAARRAKRDRPAV